MVVNKEYNPEAEEDDWSVVSDGVAQAEMADEEQVPVEAPATTRGANGVEQIVSYNVPTDVLDSLEQDMHFEEKDSTQPAVVREDTVEDSTALTNDHESQEQTPLLSTAATSNRTIKEESSKDAAMATNSHEGEKEETPRDNNNNINTATGAVGDWLRKSLSNVGARLQEIDEKHQLHQKARSSIKHVEASLKQVERTVDETSRRLAQKLAESDLPTKAKELEDRTKHAAQVLQTKAQVVGQQLQTSATKAGRQVQEISEKVPVAQVVAVAAVGVAGAVLMARGKPAAGAAVWATGGAAMAAVEIARHQNQSDRQYNEGLNEELHLD